MYTYMFSIYNQQAMVVLCPYSVHVSGRAPCFHRELQSLSIARTGLSVWIIIYIYIYIYIYMRIYIHAYIYLYVYISLCVYFFASLYPAHVGWVCGSVRVWFVLLLHLHVWNQSLPVPLVAAFPLSGCVTMRMTVAMVQMKFACPAAPQISFAVSAHRGESKWTVMYQPAQSVCRDKKRPKLLPVNRSVHHLPVCMGWAQWKSVACGPVGLLHLVLSETSEYAFWN